MDITTSPASARSLTTQAFERLRSDILLGELRPEERLAEGILVENSLALATLLKWAEARLNYLILTAEIVPVPASVAPPPVR